MQAKRRKRRAAHHLSRHESFSIRKMLIVFDDLCLDVIQFAVNLQSLITTTFGTILCRGKANKFERPFASHISSGIVFLQLRSALPLRLSKLRYALG